MKPVMTPIGFDSYGKASPNCKIPCVDLTPINDDAEPCFIVRNDEDAKLLFKNLELASRQATREVSTWYAHNAILILNRADRDQVVKMPLNKNEFCGAPTWKPLVLCFPDELLERKLSAAGVRVSSLPDIPMSLQQMRDTVRIVEPPKFTGLLDMPETVLDGWLGELCRTRMAAFPIAYAWPTLLSVASAMVPQCDCRLNLYTSLVGPVGSGKSQAMEYACGLLGIKEPPLLNVLAGSSEGLIHRLHTMPEGAPVLISVDELGHLLEKAQMDGATFPYFLDRAFYKTKFEVLMARRKEVTFNIRLSLIGGVVDDNFSNLFGSNTKGGLHDRFIFGQWPTGFKFRYREFSGPPALDVPMDGDFADAARPVAVTINPDVFALRDKWLDDEPNLCDGRVTEHAIRVAVICAAFDGRRELRARDLAPALDFARYQARIRKLLKPNPGETMEAICANNALNWLDNHAPASVNGDHGSWTHRRVLYKGIHAERFGHGVADRSLQGLEANGDIECGRDGKARVVRRLYCPN